MGSKQSSLTDNSPNSEATKKKSLYRRYEDAKKGPPLSDDDIQKHTGMTREQLTAWSQDRPGVAENRIVGDITAGPATGFGGMAAGGGFGGWGPGANGKAKFPPEKRKSVDDEDSDE